MATSARELVGWTEQRWTAVEEAAKKALARTAKCRQVIPIGAEQIGAKTVLVPTITTEEPEDLIAYGPETVTSPIQIFVDAALDDQIADDEAAVCRLVEFAAAQLGLEEDKAVIEGIPSSRQKAMAAADTPAQRRRLRTPELGAAKLNHNTKKRRQTLPFVQLEGTALLRKLSRRCELPKANWKRRVGLDRAACFCTHLSSPRCLPLRRVGRLTFSRLSSPLIATRSPARAPWTEARTGRKEGKSRTSAEFSSAWNLLPSNLSKRRGPPSRCLAEPMGKQNCVSRRMSSFASSTDAPFTISSPD